MRLRHPLAAAALAVTLALGLLLAGPGCRSRQSGQGGGSEGETASPGPTTAPAEATTRGAAPGGDAAGQIGDLSPAPIEYLAAEPVVPPLALRVEVRGQPVFVDEPLLLTVRLAFPLAERDHDRARRQAERVSASRPEAAGRQAAALDLPAAPAGWPGRVTFALFRLDGEQRQPAGEPTWAEFLAKPAEPGADQPSADWLVPPESLKLAAGSYVLTARWAGKGLVQDDWLAADGTLSAETAFGLRPVEGQADQASHAERLALLAYRQGRFAEVRRFAGQARQAVADSATPQRLRMLLAEADACLALDDLEAAKGIYRDLLAKLAPDDELAESLNKRLSAIDQAIAKKQAGQ